MTLSDWEKNGWLKKHKTSRAEIINLKTLIERDLTDCNTPGLSTDWRFAIAYNAALNCCIIALFCKGYRPSKSGGGHYYTIQSLPLTIGADFRDVRDYINTCRVRRNVSDYDTAGTISQKELESLIPTVMELYQDIRKWIAKNYPDYI